MPAFNVYWYLYLLGIVATICIAIGIKNYKKSHKTYTPHLVEMPEVLRTDLKYGFYWSNTTQVKEVKDFVNLHWEVFFGGITEGYNRILEMKRFTVLDVSSIIGTSWNSKNKYKVELAANAEDLLRLRFKEMQELGILQYIKVIVPIDEPNLNTSKEFYKGMLEVVKKVAVEFPELTGVKFGAIFWGGQGHNYKDWQFDQLDYVGFDDYKAGTSIFGPKGEYTKMKAMLLPNQKIWLLPGAFVGGKEKYQEPQTTFTAVAHRDKEVFALLPFLWADVDYEGITGIRSIPLLRGYYTIIGQNIKALNND